MRSSTFDWMVRGFPGLILVASVASLLLLPLLGFCLVFQVSEAREGIVVHEILRTGEYILPLRHGETIPSKPILFHWLGSVFAILLPQYDEFALRLPSALAAILTMTAVFALARAVSTVRTALLAAGVLSTTYVFTHLAIDGRVDMLFCCFVVAAISLWLSRAIELLSTGRALCEITEGTYCLLGVLCGFAVLAKGPLGLLLPVLVIAMMSIAFIGFMPGLRAMLRPGWLLSLAVGLPWYILATFSGKDSFLARQIIFENLTRFFGGSGIPSKPVYYYLVHLFTQIAPWFPLACLVLFFCILGRISLRAFREEMSVSERLLLKGTCVWFLTIVVFLSLSVGKRRAYLLPASPAFALMLAVYLSVWMRRSTGNTPSQILHSTVIRRIGQLLLVAVPLLALFFYFGARAQQLPFIGSCHSCQVSLYSLPKAISRGSFLLGIYFAVFLGGSLVLWHYAFSRKNENAFGLSIYCFLQLIFVVFVTSLLGIKGITHSYKEFAETVTEVTDGKREVTFLLKPGDESFDSFFFYYRSPISLLDSTVVPKGVGLYLSRRGWLNNTPEAWRENVEHITSGGRLADTPEEQLVLFELKVDSHSLRSGDRRGFDATSQRQEPLHYQ